MKPEDFDHPVIFLLTITMGVVAVIAILSWAAASFGYTGLLGLLKGGVMTNDGSMNAT
jgi:hypothetical protein